MYRLFLILALLAGPAAAQSAPASGGGDLVDDITPQLGAALDVNEFAICDGDADTCVALEEGADDDTVRLDSAGIEFFTAVYNGVDDLDVEFKMPSTMVTKNVSAYLWKDAAGSVICRMDAKGDNAANGTFWCYSGGTAVLPRDSTVFGFDARTDANGGSAYGRNATANGGDAFGKSALAYTDGVAIGNSAAARTAGFAGGNAAKACEVNGGRCVALGWETDLDAGVGTDTDFLHVGLGTFGFDTNGENSCGAIAGIWDRDNNDDCPSSGDFALGGDQQVDPWDRFAFGWGFQHAAPESVTLQVTDALGTDNSGDGGDLILRGSAGTGTGDGGEVVIQKCPAGASSATLNSCSTGSTFDGETGLFIPPKLTADPCTAGLEGGIFYNDTSNYMCYCDGTNDVQLHSPATACF